MSPALLTVRRAVRESLRDLPDDELVLVACSGGADSMVLAAGTAICGRPAAAAIIDHGLQEDSQDVARSAAQQCRDLGLEPVIVRRVEVRGPGGPEAAARSARYAALREIAGELDAAAILLAHTMDDQAETVLMRLARGSGARSLSAMAVVDADLRRPLLGLRRDLVRSAAAGMDVHEDPHNADDRYARPRVRHHGLPALVADLGDGVIGGLARSAELLREDNDALDLWASRVAFVLSGQEVAAQVTDLQGVPAAVRVRAIRRMALAAGCPGGALTRDHLRSVAALVTDWRGQGPVDLPGGVRATRKSGRLLLQR